MTMAVALAVSVVIELTHVPRDSKDKPTTPLYMKTVTITRCAK